jgi:hypothetical protein
VPAMAGMASARTNDPTSMARSPVADSASIRSMRASTGIGASFWSPSRGPTSRTSLHDG